ncbi:phosphatidylserine/phosphatidylglycerophosphate/cardiolipin synthase family protein [Streptomyces sp. NPDC059373]
MIRSPLRRLGIAAGTAITAALALVAGSTSGASAAASYRLIVQPDTNVSAIYSYITSATKSIDLTMYELVDTTAEQDLAAAEAKGVTVRVILDVRKKSTNQTAYTYLKGKSVGVAWSSSKYYYTHEKSMVVDGTTALVMSGNLTSQYYSADRNYTVVDTDTADITAIETVFTADYAGTTVTPGDGDNLVWSPTDAQSKLLALINNATSSLWIEAQEMGYSTVVNALVSAENRGVDVRVVMTNSSDDYASEFDTLTAAGVKVSTYADTASLYIHAKAIVADYGLSTAKVFVGSQNFSSTSLNSNRELGIILADTTIESGVKTVIASDYAGGTLWS